LNCRSIKLCDTMNPSDKHQSRTPYATPAVEQAARILYCLAANPSVQMSLAEICDQVGVSGSKAHGILRALQNHGLARRGHNGRGYALGAGLVTLARKVLDDLIPSRVAEPVLEALTRKTESTSVLGLITGETVYVAAKKEADENIRVVMRVGHTLPLTFGAHGKVIVAFMADADQERLLKGEDLCFYGSPDRLDRTRLMDELAQCRRQGFACDFGESAQGVNVIAAPVLGADNSPVGFVEIFVLAPPQSAQGFGPTVARAGETISRQLGARIKVMHKN
jgi:DNA-binding IclR family transcriptional regulator